MQKFLFVIILLLISAGGFSQISVASFERIDNDLTARVDHPVRDQNGDVSALIKVETTQTGFHFEGCGLGIVKTEQKIGEVWVYIPFGARRLTIHHPQLGTLRNYVYPLSIEKATTYVMQLTTGTVITTYKEHVILTEWVIIESNPSGAQVYIDDSPVGQTPYQREYSYGQYNYRVELPMYHNEAGIINLNANTGRQTITANLKPNFGSIKVTSSPENGADILLNGNPTGYKTPHTLTNIRSGKQTISCKLNMYHDAWQEVTVEDNKTTELNLKMNPAFGVLNITTEPNADIFIDNTKVGSGTYEVRKTRGFYTIEARKDKHEPHSRRIEVTDNANIDLKLSPTPKYGQLRIVTIPHDAEIYIGGKKHSVNSPVTIREILIGDYQLELRKTGYASHTQNIEITHKETTDIDVTLPDGMEVTITSNPAGADIFIGGEIKGKTPSVINLKLGKNSIVLRKQDFLEFKKDVLVNQNTKEFSFKLIPDEYITMQQDYKKYALIRYSSLTVMTASIGLCLYESYNIYDKYNQYQTATINATEIHNNLIKSRNIFMLSAGTALISSIPILIFRNNYKSTKQKLRTYALVPLEDGIIFTMQINF